MTRQALVVGINNYTKIPPLNTPANDANAIARQLLDAGFEVRGLPSASAREAWRVDPDKRLSTDELEEAIAQLFALEASISIPETALLFFAGHGLRKTLGSLAQGFLATSRVNRKDRWGLSLFDLRQILTQSPVRQQMVILDCCHSGELLNFDQADPGESETLSRCLIAACREFEASYEFTTDEHSAFTAALLHAWQQDGTISNVTLWQYVGTALAKTNQTPVCRNWGEIILRDPATEN